MSVSQRGFVARRIALFVSVVAVALFMSYSTASACACCGTYRVVHVAGWDVLNVRAGPSVRYRIVGALAHNASCISLTGPRRGNWVQVSGNGQFGWVNGRYLLYIR
jgi:uncharacterized protein YraI